jgi:hypothetical protein
MEDPGAPLDGKGLSDPAFDPLGTKALHAAEHFQLLQRELDRDLLECGLADEKLMVAITQRSPDPLGQPGITGAVPNLRLRIKEEPHAV